LGDRRTWRSYFVGHRAVVQTLNVKSRASFTGAIHAQVLPVYLARPPSARFSASAFAEATARQASRTQKLKCPMRLTHRAFSSGDVLLSHGLSPYYHRGCSVSLPCSEWERVGPLRYCHQSAEPHWHFAAVAATQARSRISGDV
jgi:hypothetical protein